MSIKRIWRYGMIIAIALLIVMIAAMCPYYKNSINALGKSLYYVDTETDVGFIYRNYYEKTGLLSKGKKVLATSFGYRIMDDIVDIDNDGTTELLCSCTWGGDGVVRLYVYKNFDETVLCGEFSPESVGAYDIYEYGSGAFLTYYDPYSGKMLAEYTTDKGSKELELSFEQLSFHPANANQMK